MTDMKTPQNTEDENELLFQVGELLFKNDASYYLSDVKQWYHAWVASDLADHQEDREQNVEVFKALETFLEHINTIDRTEFIEKHLSYMQEETDAVIMRMGTMGDA